MIKIKTSQNASEEFVFENDNQPCFMGKNPTFGYEQEFVQKIMISGKVRRVYRGKRFVAHVFFGYLPDYTDWHFNTYTANGLYWLLDQQRRLGCLYAEITSPESTTTFKGEVFLDLDESQRRFKYDADAQRYIWVGYGLTISACEVVS